MAVTQSGFPERLLFGPGPTTIDPRVCQAMGKPALGIRDPYLLKIFDEIRAGLRDVFGTKNHRTYTVPGSGSAGMEAAIANFVGPGEKIAVFVAGLFAERIVIMAQRHGLNVARLDKPWGEVFTEAEAEDFIAREKPVAVAFVQGETSTGAFQSGRAIAPPAKRHGALVIADAVTTVGAMPVGIDDIGIDVSFSCTQKGLSAPAGLAPITVSDAGWQRLKANAPWYLDLQLIANYFDPPNVYHHTPAPPLYYALHESLRIVAEEGLENRWERHRRAGLQLRDGLEELGFEYVVRDPENRLAHLAVVRPPHGVDEAALRSRLLERFGFEIAAGLGQFAGKVLRIGVMGPLATEENVERLLKAMRE